MIVVKCIKKNRDSKNNIKSYVLVDMQGQTREYTGLDIKNFIRAGKMNVINLQIDKAGRLVDKAQPKPTAKTPARPAKTPVSKPDQLNNKLAQVLKEFNSIAPDISKKDSEAYIKTALGIMRTDPSKDKNNEWYLKVINSLIGFYYYDFFKEGKKYFLYEFDEHSLKVNNQVVLRTEGEFRFSYLKIALALLGIGMEIKEASRFENFNVPVDIAGKSANTPDGARFNVDVNVYDVLFKGKPKTDLYVPHYGAFAVNKLEFKPIKGYPQYWEKDRIETYEKVVQKLFNEYIKSGDVSCIVDLSGDLDAYYIVNVSYKLGYDFWYMTIAEDYENTRYAITKRDRNGLIQALKFYLDTVKLNEDILSSMADGTPEWKNLHIKADISLKDVKEHYATFDGGVNTIID